MAKLLLSCDDCIRKFQGEFYFTNQERCDFYYRYLRVFEKLKVVNRCMEIDKPSDKLMPIDPDKIEIVEIPEFHGPKQFAKVFFRIRSVLKGVTTDCDASIVRLPSTIGQLVANQVIAAGMPYAVECVYNAEEGWKYSKLSINKLLWKKIDKDMRQTCYCADGVSCVTEFVLQKNYFSKKKIHFENHYSSLSIASDFFKSSREFPQKRFLTIAHVANQVAFNGRKGHNEIIKALSILKSHGTIVNAVFAGEDYHNGISKLIQYSQDLGVLDQVKFCGYLSRGELSNFLESSDIFILPTKAEGLPRVIIEAMAKGLPCITTPVSGNPELVQKHFLVEYSAVDILANRISELINNKELYERTSKENFENSLKYEATILQTRRDEFYNSLKALVI